MGYSEALAKPIPKTPLSGFGRRVLGKSGVSFFFFLGGGVGCLEGIWVEREGFRFSREKVLESWV